MAYKFYNSNVDGTKNIEISSGQVGSLFSTLTTTERINGDTEFAKAWIESDVDKTVYIGILDPMPYESTVFLSASDTDAVGDLLGTESRYGAMKVVSATATEIIVTNSSQIMVRSGDKIMIDGVDYAVATVVDNGTTSTITTTSSIVTPPVADDYITSMFAITLVANTAKPFWREEIVPATSAFISTTLTASLIVGG